jgi:vesicle coat complex subunit
MPKGRLVVTVSLLLPALLVAGMWVAASWWRSWRVPRLDDESPGVRAAAIRALPRKGNEARLIQMLEDEDSDVRLVAIMALVEPYHERENDCGALRARALVRALGDDQLSVRREAAWSLSFLGPDSWPVLREALEDDNPRVRAGAALALTYRHPKAPNTWPSKQQLEDFRRLLQRLTADSDPEVRHNATVALGGIH